MQISPIKDQQMAMCLLLLSNNLRSIAEDQYGNLWIGTYGGGVTKYNGNAIDDLLNGTKLYRHRPEDLKKSKKDLVKFFTHFGTKQGLSHKIVRSALEDKKGNLWFATEVGGITRFSSREHEEHPDKESSKPYTVSHFTEEHGLPGNIIYTILEDKKGHLWFGSDGGGLIKYDGQHFTFFAEKQGLINNRVFSIMESNSSDGAEGLWLGTEKGLSYLNTRENVFINLNKEDGLKAEDFIINSAYSDSDNRLWWGGGKSLTRLDLNKFQQNNVKPCISLESILLKEKFVDYSHTVQDSSTYWSQFKGIRFTDIEKFRNYPRNLELPYHINHLTFQFSAIDWHAPNKIRYQYKLEGIDEDWSSLTTDNKADYRNIPHGTYTFKLKALGGSRLWSDTFEYSFVIHPPWWLSWWAYSAYSLLVFGMAFSYIRMRESSLKKRQRELEEKVSQATFEIRKQKDEVEKQKDFAEEQRKNAESQKHFADLQKRLAEEKNREILDSIEYAKRIQTAILPPLRIIREFLENAFVLYLPKDIVAGDFYWMETVGKTIYLAACDCTGHGVPGAMVSVVCNNALNRSLNEFGEREPGKIFDRTRELILENFSKSDEEVKDGMDASLCCLNLEKSELL